MVADLGVHGFEGCGAAGAETGDGGVVGGEEDAGEVVVLDSCGVFVGDVPDLGGKKGWLVFLWERGRGWRG